MGQLGISCKSFRQIGVSSLRPIGVLLMVGLISACSTLGGEPAGDITGDNVSEINWSFADAAALEREITELKTENEELQQRIAQLQRQKTVTASADSAPPTVDLRDSDQSVFAQGSKEPAAGSGTTIVGAANADEVLTNDPVPVESAPRLVQPTFASVEQDIFENEAESSEIRLSSVLYGVHLASYRGEDEARAGWRKLQRENPDELGLLEPRITSISVTDKGSFLRLIGGGFSSKDKAAALCQNLEAKGLYCSVASFDGDRLSLADAG